MGSDVVFVRILKLTRLTYHFVVHPTDKLTLASDQVPQQVYPSVEPIHDD